MSPPGSIRALLEADHARLDALLDAATAEGTLSPEPFEAFRKGLLRHIGIEEKLLFPAARRARGGEPLPAFARLRQDHARLTAMLVPTPTRSRVDALRDLLRVHNALEEGAAGVYAACEALTAGEQDELLEKIRAAPEVPTRPHQDRIRPVKLDP